MASLCQAMRCLDNKGKNAARPPAAHRAESPPHRASYTAAATNSAGFAAASPHSISWVRGSAANSGANRSARPAGQAKEFPLIQAPGRRDALGEQIFLVQAVQDGLQLPEPGPLTEKVGQLHREKNQQQDQN